MYFPDGGCVRTLRTLYVYATAIVNCPPRVTVVTRTRVNERTLHC